MTRYAADRCVECALLPVSRLLREAAPCTVPEAELTFQLALQVLNKAASGVVFATDEQGALTGIVTLGDIRRTISSSSAGEVDESGLLNRDPVYVAPEEECSVALLLMKKRNIAVLPVVTSDRRLAGYVTIHDLIPQFSAERLYIGPEEAADPGRSENLLKHIFRYRFASMFVSQGRALDCACGSGYGANILAGKGVDVIAVDKSAEAIAFARSNYSRNNIEFVEKRLQDIDFPAAYFDAVVSLETLEHIDRDEMTDYLVRAAGWIKPGGVFVGSSPMLRYRDGKPYITSPHHVNELPREELLQTVCLSLAGFDINFFHQGINGCLPLAGETSGFCLFVGRKHVE